MLVNCTLLPTYSPACLEMTLQSLSSQAHVASSLPLSPSLLVYSLTYLVVRPADEAGHC